ncbi:hypothetical protein COCNU_scaffold001084G000040 [Cocos nucifera]|nr:hypothetical protein [Cocos nucifera]
MSDEPATKKARVNTPNFATPTNVATTTQVAAIIEVIPTIRVATIAEGSVPLLSMSPPVEDPAPQSPTGREEGDKKGKRVIVKGHHKACPGGSNNDGDSPRENPFGNPKLI